MPQLCKLQPGDPFLYSSTWISEEELSELGGMRRERSRQTYQRAFPVICFRDQQEISRSVQKPLGVPQSSIAQTAYGHPSKPEVLSHTSPPTHSADSSVCVCSQVPPSETAPGRETTKESYSTSFCNIYLKGFQLPDRILRN